MAEKMLQVGFILAFTVINPEPAAILSEPRDQELKFSTEKGVGQPRKWLFRLPRGPLAPTAPSSHALSKRHAKIVKD
tara:strand:- start:99 stop:329 length:231 start_codon:yes stop_codon:yes gene_type:complete